MKQTVPIVTAVIFISTLAACPAPAAAMSDASEFRLELDASSEGGILMLDFTVVTPAPADWINYLVVTAPAAEIIPFLSIPLPIYERPTHIPIRFPAPGAGLLGVWSALSRGSRYEIAQFAWVDMGTSCGLPDTGQETSYYGGDDGYYDTGCQLSFTDNGDGTVTDNCTGLMWQKEDDNIDRNWWSAVDHCNYLLTPSGYNDWRLPNVKELQSILDYSISQPMVDETYFPSSSHTYWSSTTLTGSGLWFDYAWYVVFSYGVTDFEDKIEEHRVRCVRQ